MSSSNRPELVSLYNLFNKILSENSWPILSLEPTVLNLQLVEFLIDLLPFDYTPEEMGYCVNSVSCIAELKLM